MAVDGNWKVTMQTPMGSRDVNLTLKTDGDNLSGSWGGAQGTQEFSGGKVDGNNLTWSVMMSGAMGQMELKFNGKVDGDNISGDVQFGSFGSGTFTGTRQS